MINGEKEAGATMFYLGEDMDAGDIIDQKRICICPEDDAPTLADRLIPHYVAMVEKNVPLLEKGVAPRRKQNPEQATYAIWRVPDDGLIDWRLPAARIHNLVRGLTNPYPGAFTFWEGKKLFVWKSRVCPEKRLYLGGVPGKVEKILPGIGVNVLTGEGILTLLEVQLEGQDRVNASQVIRRLKMRLG